MGSNTFNVGQKRSAVSEAEAEKPYITKVIAKLRDGLYPVNRVAFLKEWSYFVVETGTFKCSFKITNSPEDCETLSNIGNTTDELFIIVDGDEYALASKSSKNVWQIYDSEKCIALVCDVDTNRLPLPTDLDDGAVDLPPKKQIIEIPRETRFELPFP